MHARIHPEQRHVEREPHTSLYMTVPRDSGLVHDVLHPLASPRGRCRVSKGGGGGTEALQRAQCRSDEELGEPRSGLRGSGRRKGEKSL